MSSNGLQPGYGLVWFLGVMQRKLEDNKGKGGWSRCTREYLLRRLDDELAELRSAIKKELPSDVIASEAADVANFAMMIADNAKGRK